MHAAIQRCGLDLSGLVVLTEAASGPYVVTPILAALAGADHVYALARSTRHGTVDEISSQTLELARLLDVQKRIEIITQKSQAVVSQADIITNSGHVRPIGAEMIGWMKQTAVVPLMYESWEFRAEDIDLEACRRNGILVAGTNEQHPALDVFSFLGVMGIKQLLDAGIAVYTSRILLLCDNQFGPFIERSLRSVGAHVDVCANLSAADLGNPYDSVLVALQPHLEPVLSSQDAELIAKSMPGTVVVQFWGDIDRLSFSAAGVPLWPIETPAPGHMGVLLSDVGPDPVVRLQVGGLKVGEVLARGKFREDHADREFVQSLQEERYA